MKFSVFQLSRRGGREKNEDRMGYSYTRDAVLFLLADGMGGHPEGEMAAQIALQTLSTLFQRDAKPSLPSVQGFLATGVMADIPGDHLPSLSTDDAHAGLPAWHTVKETTLRSWTISRCEVHMVFLGGR